MNEYNYQRMVEEAVEQYERTLPADPEEQALLTARINGMRKDLRISVFKDLIADRCHVAGLDKRPLIALTETPAMEEYLYTVQTEILTRVAKADRAMELDATRDPELHEIH